MIGSSCLYDAYVVSMLYHGIENNGSRERLLNIPTGRARDVRGLEDAISRSGVSLIKFESSFNNESFTLYNMKGIGELKDVVLYGVMFGDTEGALAMLVHAPWKGDNGFVVIREDTDISELMSSSIDKVVLKDHMVFMKISQKIKHYKAVPKAKYDELTELNLGLTIGSVNSDFIFAADNEGKTLVFDGETGMCVVKHFSDIMKEDIIVVCYNEKPCYTEEEGYHFDPSVDNVYLESIDSNQFVFNGHLRDIDTLSMDELYGEASVQTITSNAIKKVKRIPMETVRRIKGLSNKMRKAYGSFVRAKEDETRERIINDEIFPISDKIINTCVSAILAYGTVAMGIVNPVMGLLIFVGTKTILRSKSNKKREMALHFLKKELEILDEKISDSKVEADKDAKYKLMRIRNKIEKKIEQVRTEDIVA